MLSCFCRVDIRQSIERSDDEPSPSGSKRPNSVDELVAASPASYSRTAISVGCSLSFTPPDSVDSHYMHHLRQDSTGSRDPDDVRTPKQRLADVMLELLTNRDTITGEFVTETVGVKAKASTQLILVAPFGVVDGTNPDGHVEIIGTGPVPRHILVALTPDTELAGMIFNRQGRPAPRSGHPRRRLLRMRSPHAPMRTPPHPGMAPRL